MLPIWARPTAMQNSGPENSPCSGLNEVPRVRRETEGASVARGRGIRHNPEEARALLHSSEAGTGHGRGSEPQRARAHSQPYAAKGYGVGDRWSCYALVPSKRALVHCWRVAHLSSVCFHRG